jgi:hypothetical protein
MNVEIETLAAQFLFWESLFQIFGIGSLQCISSQPSTAPAWHTANNFGLMYSRKRISQNSFSNFIHIIPKSFMEFCQELHNPKRNYENQI